MSVWREDPAKVRPMLASLDSPPLAQAGLFYEPKYDGIRALADVRPPARRGATPHVALYSRNGNDKTPQFPAIVAALAGIAATLDGPILIDGEIVALDKADRPLGFQHIQGRIHLTSPVDIARADVEAPAAFIAFDLLRDASEDLRGQPLAARRLRLQQRVRVPARARRILRVSEMVADDGRPLHDRAVREGWEGLIAKDGRSPYHSGRRTPAWRKLKLLNEQEFVIGGWTEPRMSRQHFGALLVGYYEDDALRWAGSVGTGFDQKELDRVARLLRAREIASSPFAESFKTIEKRHWVKPDLVAQVRFTEWTHEGLLRQPVYLGLREDKKAREVRREGKKVPGSHGPKVPGAGGPEVPGSQGSKRRTPHAASRTSHGSARTSHAAPRTSHAAPRTSHPAPRTAHGSVLLDRLSELEDAKRDGEIELPNGDRLRVTNLAKLFWPKLGITKGELLRYYVAVSPMLLPAVDDRPLVMKRFPNGVDTHAFYQQRHPEAVPAGVRREVLPEDIEPIDEEGPRDRLIGGSLTTLLYMTQLAAISQDPWFSRVADPEHQDYAAIDLDPGEGAGFDRVLDVARWVKEELDRLAIPGVPKTSGSRGLHIYIPLPPRTTYETGQLLCQVVATLVSTKHPKVATVERMVKRRPRATVYVDYLQNILGKTLATAYSARASDYAGVSTPLTWTEVAEGLDPRAFTIRTALSRFTEVGDLWKRLRTGKAVDISRILAKRA
jgi:bifunctional non-homologous end joining protein LigD